MRYLTEKQLDALSWRDMKLYFLETYEEDAKRWENESDDRNLEVTLKRGNEVIKFTNVVVAPAPTENDGEDSTKDGDVK